MNKEGLCKAKVKSLGSLLPFENQPTVQKGLEKILALVVFYKLSNEYTNH